MAKWRQTTAKPPLGARIDWSNPITQGLKCCVLFQQDQNSAANWKVQDLANNWYVKIVDNAKVIGGKLILDGTGDTWGEIVDGYGTILPPDDFPKVPPFTVFSKMVGNALQTTNALIAYRNGANGWGIKPQQNSSTYKVGFTKFGVVDLTSSINSITNEEISIGAIAYNDNTVTVFQNTEFEHFSNTQSYISTDKYVLIGASWNAGSTADQLNGDVYCLYVWDKTLSQDELKQLHYEPYSFFEIPSLYIPVSWKAQSSQQTGKHRIVTSDKWKQTTQKPPLGARIDWSNPITKDLVGCWLFNEHGGGIVYNIAGFTRSTLNATEWKNGGLFFNGSNAYVNDEKVDELMKKSNDATIFLSKKAKYTGNDRALCGTRVNAQSGDDGVEIRHDASGYSGGASNCFKCCYSNAWIETEGGVQTTEEQRIFLVREDAVRLDCFLDGKKLGITASGNINVSTPLTSSDTHLTIGVGPKDYWWGDIYWFYYWNRPLTDDEIKLLHYEPYSFFETPSMRTVVAFSSGGTTITADDATHSQTADNATLSVTTSLTANDATHAQTADNVTITVGTTITADDAIHSQFADNATLGLTVNITANDATHAQTADNAILIDTVTFTITVKDNNDDPIQGASVTITRQDNGSTEYTGTTDTNGQVSDTVHTGTLIFKIAKSGKKTVIVTRDVDSDFTMEVYMSKTVPLIITGCGVSINLAPTKDDNVLYS